MPLARTNPADSYTRRLLGLTLTYHGFEQERVNQTDAALRSFREAVPILEAQVRDNPNDAQTRRKLTLGYNDKAVPRPHSGNMNSPLHIRALASLNRRRASTPGRCIPSRRP